MADEGRKYFITVVKFNLQIITYFIVLINKHDDVQYVKY
jgi:hypothetical protein